MLLALNKPYGYLSRMTPDGSPNKPLADLAFPPRVHPIGRLDADSEGLLLLSDEARWNDLLLNPRQGHWRTYWAQVERIPNDFALQRLRTGLIIQDFKTRPARARLLDPPPDVWPRDTPIRFRKNVPDCWLELQLTEGKNRQVRRMTAAVGHPTLRLIRAAIGELTLAELGLPPGKWKELNTGEQARLTHPRQGSG